MGKPQVMLSISKLLRKGKMFMLNWKGIPPNIEKNIFLGWKPGHKMAEYKCDTLSPHVY